MSKRFTKKREDFNCANCGAQVMGTGYTNHCPKCLWSKHVDINPGDRAEECGGMMKPVDLYMEGQNWVLIHECERCDTKKRNIISTDDDFDEVIKLSKQMADKKMKK